MIEIKFKQMRLATGLTQKQVADALGIDQTSVHLWEVGKTKPRANLLPAVAKLYGCTVDELLKEE